MALTALEIKHAKEGTYVDGNGLYLQVNSAGAKSWIFRYQINGRRRMMGLGALVEKTAVLVREEIPALRRMVAAKIDPLELKEQARAEVKIQAEKAKLQSITFEATAFEYIKKNRAGWSSAKHAWQWENSLSLYAFPVFGSVPVGNLTTDHILTALTPIWISKTETATRVRQRIESILDYARVKDYRAGDNPARWRGHLEHTLPKPSSVQKVQHQPALPYKNMGEFMAELHLREGNGARALEFAVLTAARSGEVRGATWSEIDMDGRVWVVPADRMKGKKEHSVPLSDRAWNLLATTPLIAGQDLIFPGQKLGKPLSDMTVKASIMRINADRLKAGMPAWVDGKSGATIVPHGFRSSFRDWAGEVTDYPGEMGELALAHAVGDKVEAAYRRGNMFEKRRKMMNDWAAWCDPKIGSALVPLWANVA